jgi:hypothetical protein
MVGAPGCPIDQIVTSWQGLNSSRKVLGRVIGINELEGAPFWNDVAGSASVAPTITDQIAALRPFWLHAPFLAVVLPYGLGNEADWFFAFAERAMGRPAGYGKPLLELHVSFDGKPEGALTRRLVRSGRGRRCVRGRVTPSLGRQNSPGDGEEGVNQVGWRIEVSSGLAL